MPASRHFRAASRVLFLFCLLLSSMKSSKAQTSYKFVPVAPCRIADTRGAIGPFGGPTPTGGSTRSFTIPSSSCGIPSTAAAYSLNVTVVPQGPLSWLTIWPVGQTEPVVSTLNSFDGRIKANAAIVPAGTGGAINVFVTNTTDVILDINGYFVPSAASSALAFYPLAPCRIADTRSAPAPLAGPSMTSGETRTFPVLASSCNIPSSALAYSLNFTVVPQGPLSWLTVWPAGEAEPGVSTLNAPTGTVTANAAIVPAGSGGSIDAFVTNTTDLIIDINGYFAPPEPGGLAFYTLTPCRVLDTRESGNGQPFSGTINVNVVGSGCSVPSTAQAFVFNTTVIPTGVLSYLTVWPEGTMQPGVSTLNAFDGTVTANMAIVPTNNGSISAFATDSTQLIFDISGYFAPAYTIGGTVSGLSGTGLVLQDNGDDSLSVSANGGFTFATSLASGSNYNVSVLTQPSSPSQNCVVTNASGLASANVTSVQVSCSTGTSTYTIGGTVSGLLGTGLALQDNTGNNLPVSANGSFTFTTTIARGGTYNVTVLTQPSNPAQICGITNGSGTANATVTNVQVTCTASAAVPTVQIVVPGFPPLQAGQAARTVTITVANDHSGDLPSVTSFTLGGVACAAATCGSFGAVTGTAGSGSYTVLYTPPTSLAAAIAPSVSVSPSVSSPWFAGTTSFTVNPAGVVLTSAASPGIGFVELGTGPRTLTFTVYNDVGNAGVTIAPLTASGYACQNLSTNSCGILGTPSKSISGTTTTTTVTYTPPPVVPAEPYDRPRIQVTSVADPTKVSNTAFIIAPAFGPESIPGGQILDSVLTSGAAVTLNSNFSDTTSVKSASWTITAGAVSCTVTSLSTPCVTPSGTLAVPTVTTNGNSVTSSLVYTPPASVPTSPGEANPTITATEIADSTVTGGFSFDIVNGACGTGNNALLNGQYAFLLKGGGATVGYQAIIGSFTADGNGNITGGFEDINRSTGILTDLALTGSYSVGSDNRGCVTLINSNGGTAVFRVALGTVSGTTATQGTMTGFSDTTGAVARTTGVLKQQDLTNLTSATFSGIYAFGREGVDSLGNRFAAAGLITPNGAGVITNTNFDFNDGGTAGTLTGGSGSYSLTANAPGGRGTIQTTINSTTANYTFYVVSPSDLFAISTDATDANHPIVIGENKLQTGTFSSSVLNGSGYVFYAGGVDPSNGGSGAVIGQSQFTTGGSATVTLDENDNGIDEMEASGPATYTVASNGRTTGTGTVLGYSSVIYLVDSTQGFLVGSGPGAFSGYVQKQTLSSFSTSTISGQFFFGGGAPTTGGTFDSGTASFNPSIPSGTITGTDDSSGPNYTLGCQQNCGGGGLDPNSPISGTYNFTTVPAAPGQGNLGGEFGYIISPSKVVFMNTGTQTNTNPAEIFIAQQ